MNNLYIDNFRGFKKTFLPLKQVNFFLGENSTGKTSVLSLMLLLSSEDFWIRGVFKTSHFDFRSFQDIATDNTKPIALGLYKDSDNKEKDRAVYLEFKSVEDVPTLNYISYLTKNKIFHIKVEGREVYYKTAASEKYSSTRDLIVKWSSEKNGQEGYKKLGKKFRLVDSPVYLLYAVANEKEDINSIGDVVPYDSVVDDMTWFAPIRNRPQRIYEASSEEFSAEGKHIPQLLYKFFSKKKLKSSEPTPLMEALNTFGTSSGLFESINIERFGEDTYAPYALNILLNKKHRKISSVGYGVSQILPIITEILSRNRPTFFVIQQPEIHLHPKAQASFGTFIYEAAIRLKQNFIIETHSDFVVDRFRLEIRKEKPEGLDSQVVFFERNEEGNKLSCIDITKNGEYSEKQPVTFREFFIREELDKLRY